MPYVKIENNIVVQKQTNQEDGFIEAPDNVICGFVYDGQDFSPPSPSPKTWDDVRYERNILLSNSDWTQSSDSPLTQSQKTEWATYRKSLRDITDNFKSPDNVVWPSRPM